MSNLVHFVECCIFRGLYKGKVHQTGELFMASYTGGNVLWTLKNTKALDPQISELLGLKHGRSYVVCTTSEL